MPSRFMNVFCAALIGTTLVAMRASAQAEAQAKAPGVSPQEMEFRQGLSPEGWAKGADGMAKCTVSSLAADAIVLKWKTDSLEGVVSLPKDFREEPSKPGIRGESLGRRGFEQRRDPRHARALSRQHGPRRNGHWTPARHDDVRVDARVAAGTHAHAATDASGTCGHTQRRHAEYRDSERRRPPAHYPHALARARGGATRRRAVTEGHAGQDAVTNDMRADISSRTTFVYKFIFPAIWIPLFGFVGFTALHAGRNGGNQFVGYILAAVWVIVSSLLLRLAISLMRVQLRDGRITFPTIDAKSRSRRARSSASRRMFGSTSDRLPCTFATRRLSARASAFFLRHA